MSGTIRFCVNEDVMSIMSIMSKAQLTYIEMVQSSVSPLE